MSPGTLYFGIATWTVGMLMGLVTGAYVAMWASEKEVSWHDMERVPCDCEQCQGDAN